MQVIVSGTPQPPKGAERDEDDRVTRITGSPDAIFRSLPRPVTSVPTPNVIMAEGGPAQWAPTSGVVTEPNSGFRVIAPQSFQVTDNVGVSTTSEPVRSSQHQGSEQKYTTFAPTTSTAGQQSWNSNFPNMMPLTDVGSAGYGGPRYLVPPLNPPAVHPRLEGPPKITGPDIPGPGGPLMPPPYWVIKDPDQTGDDIMAAKDMTNPWSNMIVGGPHSDDPNAHLYDEYSIPANMSFDEWYNHMYQPSGPVQSPQELWDYGQDIGLEGFGQDTRSREGTDYWSSGLPFNTTMSSEQIAGLVNKYQVEHNGRTYLDTYKMVQENPEVFSYPYREEDPDGEWQPALGSPINPTMAKRPVPMESPFYDLRGYYGRQVLDDLARQGFNMDPHDSLDKPGYNPRVQEEEINDAATPRAVAMKQGVLERIYGRMKGK